MCFTREWEKLMANLAELSFVQAELLSLARHGRQEISNNMCAQLHWPSKDKQFTSLPPASQIWERLHFTPTMLNLSKRKNYKSLFLLSESDKMENHDSAFQWASTFTYFSYSLPTPENSLSFCSNVSSDPSYRLGIESYPQILRHIGTISPFF